MPAKRLSGPTQLTNAPVTQYTVAAGESALVRHVHVSNPGPIGGASINFTMSIGADAANTRTHDQVAVPAGATLDWYPYLSLAAAERIDAFASTTGVLVMEIMGDRNISG